MGSTKKKKKIERKTSGLPCGSVVGNSPFHNEEKKTVKNSSAVQFYTPSLFFILLNYQLYKKRICLPMQGMQV